MKRFPAVTALALTFALSLAPVPVVNAKTVWRCGEGGRSYSESPCPGGQPVTVADNRSAAQTRAAQDDIKRSQDLASRMRKDRLEDENRNRAANALAGNLGPSKAAAKPPEKPKTKAKSKRRPTQAAAADDGTLRAAAAPSRRKKD